MKKISLPKIRRSKKDDLPSRITNDTVAEHREQVLAGGRRFKYPIQYTRHKLVINALIVTLSSLVLMTVLGWWQLYLAQNSSDFFYRLTRAIPVPVASIDGEMVNYSDYLAKYRASEHYLSKYGDIQANSENGKRQLEYTKRQSIDKAIEEAYASKLARESNITVSDADIDAAVAVQRMTPTGDIPHETFNASMMMIYGWSEADYRQVVKNNFITTRVAFDIDSTAKSKMEQVKELLASEADFAKIAERVGGEGSAKVTSGSSGRVNNTSMFSGISVAEINKLKVGEISEIIRSQSSEGYYFVRVTAKTDTQLEFEYIHVPLTEFKKRIQDLKSSGKVHEFISIPEQSTENK